VYIGVIGPILSWFAREEKTVGRIRCRGDVRSPGQGRRDAGDPGRGRTDVGGLGREALALYYVWGDSRVPLRARLLAVLVAAYALSPIDLVPDFIPVLGYLDDLLLIPLGVRLVMRQIPPQVMAEARARARTEPAPRLRAGALLVIGIWIVAAALLALILRHYFA